MSPVFPATNGPERVPVALPHSYDKALEMLGALYYQSNAPSAVPRKEEARPPILEETGDSDVDGDALPQSIGWDRKSVQTLQGAKNCLC